MRRRGTESTLVSMVQSTNFLHVAPVTVWGFHTIALWNKLTVALRHRL